MDDLYLDALGITEEVELLGLRGSMRKKGRRLDDEDFNPIMRPILLEEVPKVVSALRQAVSNKRILVKLLIRMLTTTDPLVHSQLMRLRGFSLMALLLEEYVQDPAAIVLPILEIMQRWPLISRNKLSSTSVELVVARVAADSSDNETKSLATQLLSDWSELQLAYRIPRDMQTRKHALDDVGPITFPIKRARIDDICQIAPSLYEAAAPTKSNSSENLKLPDGWQSALTSHGARYYFHTGSRTTTLTLPSKPEADAIHQNYLAKLKKPGLDLEDIIARASAEAETIKQLKNVLSNSGADTESQQYLEASSRKDKKDKREKLPLSKERKMLRLFSPLVVKAMTKYTRGVLSKEEFKRRAQELTNLLVEKEMKSVGYINAEYDTLSGEKEKKIRQFAKEWIVKLLARKDGNGTGGLMADLTSMAPNRANNPEAVSVAEGPISEDVDGASKADQARA